MKLLHQKKNMEICRIVLVLFLFWRWSEFLGKATTNCINFYRGIDRRGGNYCNHVVWLYKNVFHGGLTVPGNRSNLFLAQSASGLAQSLPDLFESSVPIYLT